MSEIANRVLKNSGYLYFSMGLSMFVSLYSTRLILNALGSSDFGIFCIIGGGNRHARILKCSYVNYNPTLY